MSQVCLSSDSLCSLVDRFHGKHVLIIGDVMVDEYLVGSAERISPEAPVPVVRVNEDHHVIGGAGNVARNIQSLGGKPYLLCVTGDGSGADKLDSLLKAEHIDHECIRITGRKTTIKTRIMASRQQMLRIDREDISPVEGAGQKALFERMLELAPRYDVVIVSDYGKGIVSESFMQELSCICSHSPRNTKILVDPKTPNFKLYKNVFMLTPNAKETSEGAGLPVATNQEVIAAGQAIFDLLGCERLLTTLGPNGMALFEGRETVWHIPTMAREVFDVTGAGDTVIATVALALAAGHSLLDACILSNYAAGIVVGHIGAACVVPQDLQKAIQDLDLPSVEQWL